MTAALSQPQLQKRSWRQRVLRGLPWHRRLALLAAFGVLCWAASGMLHPLMSALQPQPTTVMPPAAPLLLEDLRPPAQVLLAAGITEVQALRLLRLDDHSWYQVRLPGQAVPRYFDAQSGAEADLQARHAEQLAAHYLASAEPLRFAGLQQGFDAEYVFINRLLPVARVDTQRPDGLRLYVDLFQDRLGSLVDDRKATFSQLFLWLHSFRWLDGSGPLRAALMLGLLLACGLTVALGLALFLARRQARDGLRRWHGRTAVLLGVTTLTFVGSGAWHLLHKLDAAPLPADFQARFASASLTAAPGPAWLQAGEALTRVSLLQLDGQPIWRVQGLRFGQLPSLRYLALDGSALDEQAPLRYAEQRFAQYAAPLGLDRPQQITVQRGFDHDYGFVFKRLPVLKASYADAQHSALFIDPLDGALAARVDDSDRREGFSFAYLHKWEALSALGKPVKDGALTLLGLAHLLLVAAGLWLWWRSRRPGRRKALQPNENYLR